MSRWDAFSEDERHRILMSLMMTAMAVITDDDLSRRDSARLARPLIALIVDLGNHDHDLDELRPSPEQVLEKLRRLEADG